MSDALLWLPDAAPNGALAASALEALLAPGGWAKVLAAALLFAVGLLLARLSGVAARRLVERRGTAQQALIARRTAFYGVLFLTVAGVLRQLGVDLSVLLGAAGVLTVALGFAAQTSASNLISGLFLLGERPFVVGDWIHVGNTTGQVMSIDLLSVKLRTLDNVSVRVPNETMIKSEVVNYTRFPIRRVDLRVRVDYRADLDAARAALLAIAVELPLCLDEPRPQVVVKALGDAGVELQLSLWTTSDRVVELSDAAQQAMLDALARGGVPVAVGGGTTAVVPGPMRTGTAVAG